MEYILPKCQMRILFFLKCARQSQNSFNSLSSSKEKLLYSRNKHSAKVNSNNITRHLFSLLWHSRYDRFDMLINKNVTIFITIINIVKTFKFWGSKVLIEIKLFLNLPNWKYLALNFSLNSLKKTARNTPICFLLFRSLYTIY